MEKSSKIAFSDINNYSCIILFLFYLHIIIVNYYLSIFWIHLFYILKRKYYQELLLEISKLILHLILFLIKIKIYNSL